MTTKKTEQLNFEQSLEQLNKLVDTMEKGNLPLEDTLKHFESGVALIQSCQKALADAEQKVQILTQKNNQETLDTFDSED